MLKARNRQTGQSRACQAARAEIRRERDKDELTPEHERDPCPPTHHNG